MHLHGHHFWVLKQGTAQERKDNPYYYLDTVLNKTTCGSSCTNKPNHRDIVSVPAAGYAVIRFQANNTGIDFCN